MNKRTLFAVLFLSVMIAAILSSCAGANQNAVITMSESSLTLTAGSSANLTVTDASGSAVSPLTWTSTDDNIASVDNGTVKGKSVGSAVIKATTEKGASCSCNVTVTDKEITKITLDHQTATVDSSKTIQLNATITPPDATSTNLTWSSSDESVAVVNSEGYVTGVKEGVANISCKAANGVEASCTVTVKGSASANQTSSSNNDNNNSNNNNSNNNNITPAQPADNGGYYGHFAPSYHYSATDFVFPDSSVRQLTRGEISSVLSSMSGSSVSGTFAQDAINEIYARNGYCFRDEKIRNYYEAQPWYYADESFTTSDFNSVEKYNIDLLLEYT
ncbi:MAG: Ig-like domain-containing protein [Ruminococcus sp.]|uniref:Ig-like domain-containing protein n=1 Tax=Ruminococcus sp. TaxID=41978 RepID=UPI002873CFBA|nr:Ig-like domain-containing protein [Ruminococcus sp.]MBQ3284180.1 Ig-like domain-containing protein [Ruminococcus sp.]